MFSRELPWIKEAKTAYGLHEVEDNAELKAWLKSDGKTLGDPAVLPWCADFVETAIKKTLPTEPFPGALKENAYWARNWLLFGKAVEPCYGCILVFGRDGGGHVGFAVGHNDKDFFVLGGNQSNRVSVTRIDKKRLLGARWPSTYDKGTKPLPVLSANNIPKTTNEF